jgi:hypothetical protein
MSDPAFNTDSTLPEANDKEFEHFIELIKNK